MVTAATPDLEPAWLEQMSDGGTLVAPVVFAPGMAFVIRGEVRHGVFQGRLMRGAYFMALRAEEEAPQDKTESPSANGQLKTRPAPWAGWFERQRPRLGWGGFAQALTFYGWLRGLDVLHGGGHSAYANFGLASGVDVCWFGSEDWQVSGSAGQDIGETLWRAWLAAGGPWPTEFVLSASEAEMAGNGAEVYRRRGARCWQVWELMRLRERAGWR
jgi:hypothetical protein